MREENGPIPSTSSAPSLQIPMSYIHRHGLTFLLDNVPEMVFIKDCEGRYEYMNAAALASLGHERDYLDGRTLTIFDLAPKQVADCIDRLDRRILSNNTNVYDAEEPIAADDGTTRWYSGTRIILRDDDGTPVGLAGVSREITLTKRQETMRKSHAALLEMIVKGKPLKDILAAVVREVESLLDHVCGSVLLLDEKTALLRNGAAPSLPKEYVSKVDGVPVGPTNGSCGTAAFRREPVYVSDTLENPLWTNYVEAVKPHGLRSCWSTPVIGNNNVLLGTFALYSKAVRMPTETEKEIIDMATNIAGIAIDRRRAEERVHYMAHHDPLTGLSNRNLFWGQFRRALHEAKREGRLVATTYLDVDKFKQINDLHGHAAGDDVLRAIAERITKNVRASDIAVRLGGDEFAIIFSNPKRDEAGVMTRLEAIRQAVQEPIAISTGAITVTCSMGTAFYPTDGTTPENLLARADTAMYEAKRVGRDAAKAGPEVGSAA